MAKTYGAAMKLAIIVGLALLFVFTCVRDSQALDLHPDLIERCPKLSNPIECRDHDDDERDSGSNRDGRSDFDYLRAREHAGEQFKQREEKQCDRYKLFYLTRHPGGTPDSLRDEHGCERWREDYDFHSGHSMGSEGFSESLDAIVGDLRLTLGLVR